MITKIRITIHEEKTVTQNMQLKIEKAEWNTENEKQYRPLRQDGNKYESNLSNVSCLNTPIKRLPMWIKRQLYVVYKKLNLNTLCKNKGVEKYPC